MRYGIKRRDGKWAFASKINGLGWSGTLPDRLDYPFITTDINQAHQYCDWCLSYWPSIGYRVEELSEGEAI